MRQKHCVKRKRAKLKALKKQHKEKKYKTRIRNTKKNQSEGGAKNNKSKRREQIEVHIQILEKETLANAEKTAQRRIMNN